MENTCRDCGWEIDWDETINEQLSSPSWNHFIGEVSKVWEDFSN